MNKIKRNNNSVKRVVPVIMYGGKIEIVKVEKNICTVFDKKKKTLQNRSGSYGITCIF